jgi:iron complex transport system substrate-binding protein
MKRAVPLLACLLAGCAQAQAPAAHGGGIVSTNPCADAILLRLVPAQRIAAISAYSQDPAASSIPIDLARRFPSTAGTAEEVIALNPALVLTSSFTPQATRDAYARAGLKTLLLDSPTTAAASEAQVLQIADAVGAPERGKLLVAEIERALAQTPPRRRPGPSRKGASNEAQHLSNNRSVTGPRPTPGMREGDPSALLFLSGNLANGSGTLLDELMRRAGLRNAAADYGLSFTGNLPIETIAAHPPRVILSPEIPSRTAALRRRVLAAEGARTIDASFPHQLANCGGPTIIPAIARLAAIRRAAQP